MNPDHVDAPAGHPLEQQIEAWRAFLRSDRAVATADADELEDHLREQIAGLRADGLSDDEAFLVAVKRMGAIDALTREFAREHSDRLWKQLVLLGDGDRAGTATGSTDGYRRMWTALAFAVAAGVTIKIPALFGVTFDDETFFVRNAAFFSFPFIAGYLGLDRGMGRSAWTAIAAAFLVTLAAVNLYPFPGPPVVDTQGLSIIHLPLALWMLVGVAYVGGRWQGNPRRMDFVRFTGELFIYFVLIALGGGVLIGLTLLLFAAIGIDVELVVQNWILPCGMVGATVVASWLVEAKQSVIENMAPVLTRVFSPLFAFVLLAFVVTMVATGNSIQGDREVLIAFDLLLAIVFGLLLYSISARDETAEPGLADWIQLALVVAALVVDVLALRAISGRISEFGSTPNRLAALGENVILLVNLAGAAVLYARFFAGKIAFRRLYAWQVTYLYVIAGWAAIVALAFPPIFGFR